MNLHWFHGIGWQTSVRDIGWVWLFLAALLVVLAVLTVRLVKDLRGYRGNPDVCMCGSEIDSHGMSDNHSPVSETEYLARDGRRSYRRNR